MKSSTSWQCAILLTGLAFAPLVSAITPAEETEKKCVKPKFRDFSPAPNLEVKPESDISFHINRNADPLHVSASAKKIPLKVVVNDKKTFYYVTAKLPAELRDGFARIHIEAKAAEGDCLGQDGWLIKVSEQAGAASETKTETAEKQSPPTPEDSK